MHYRPTIQAVDAWSGHGMARGMRHRARTSTMHNAQCTALVAEDPPTYYFDIVSWLSGAPACLTVPLIHHMGTLIATNLMQLIIPISPQFPFHSLLLGLLSC